MMMQCKMLMMKDGDDDAVNQCKMTMMQDDNGNTMQDNDDDCNRNARRRRCNERRRQCNVKGSTHGAGVGAGTDFSSLHTKHIDYTHGARAGAGADAICFVCREKSAPAPAPCVDGAGDDAAGDDAR